MKESGLKAPEEITARIKMDKFGIMQISTKQRVHFAHTNWRTMQKKRVAVENAFIELVDDKVTKLKYHAYRDLRQLGLDESVANFTGNWSEITVKDFLEIECMLADGSLITHRDCKNVSFTFF